MRLSDAHRPKGSLVKVLNCFKNELVDRQIGDRRGQNSYERRLLGPRRDLPAGVDMMDMQVNVGHQKVVVVITDRKDYYHQLYVTPARFSTNAVGPSVHKMLLQDTDAYSAYMLASSMSKRARRGRRGANLHDFSLRPGEASDSQPLPKDSLWACFESVLQGDHAGVEIATSAHERWLQQFGLLDEQSRLIASRCLRSNSLLQGLVIDDYFAASVEDVKVDNMDSKAARCYAASQRAYSQAALLGAYVHSSSRALSRGLCTVGAPAMKRVALSFITLALCQLTGTTDSLHLCLLGGWVSFLAFRRPLVSLLAKSFQLVDQNDLDELTPRSPRSVVNELVLLAVLMPLALSDLGAENYPRVFATDASNDKGAICRSELSLPVLRALWKSCRSKGSYTRILSPAEKILKSNGMFDEEKLYKEKLANPQRRLAYEFDFIEVFSGASA